ncbi:MAG: DEAD/DEAH box helicase [Bacteroidota bacterium]
MKQVEYQEKYIRKLADTAIEFLEDRYQDESTIIFQAPTGSGKTYMVSQSLTQIVKRCKESLSFIWISVNTLHEQSRQNLLRYLEDERLLDCISIDEIQNKNIEENEIVFFNWDSLIKENNVFRMDNESDWNLQNVVANTKEEGRRIILIIDESHRTARAAKALEVIKEISPILTIEITATPKDIRGTLIKIPLAEVIAEGMIKKEVQINPGAQHIKENKNLLEIALKKRKQLKTDYESLGININPLLLIQIPNKKSTDSSNPEDYIVGLLAEHNITVSNKKLSIWLSEIKENKELVEQNDSSVDVLIFKEAIAVGWDCPRASILFLQREWKQDRYIFNIQTLGRIMRMPEQKQYANKPDLNVGYVYSASDNFEIVQELASDYVSSLQMERDEDKYLKPIKIHSEFIRRKRELTRLSGEFKKCLLQAADLLKTKEEINSNVKEIKKSFGVEGKATAIDIDQNIEFTKRINIKKDIHEIADSYSIFCGEMATPFAKVRSSQIIKSSLRSWFKQEFDITDEDQISIIVMQRNNNSKFKLLIENAKDIYQQLPIRSEEIVVKDDWEIPETISIFTDFAEVAKSNKSIIKENDEKKFFVKKNKNGELELSKPEKLFIESLENTDDELQWWFKNSHGESKYFGIAYKKANGHMYGFYPDFIIKTKKETIIVEIKDDNDFKAENVLKLRSGQDYLAKYKHKEKLRFYILSPVDYDNFFQLLQGQELNKYNSLYEERLLRYNKSNLLLLESKNDKTDKDTIELELLTELDKTINELKNAKLKNELLEMELSGAQENILVLSESLWKSKPEEEKVKKIKIKTPFNICVLGEVSNEEKIVQALQLYFSKQSLNTNDWEIKFFNNTKIQKTEVLRLLVKGQSKYDIIITGQIHNHSGKGNKKANIISELNNEKYIPHIIGSNPKELLTPDKVLNAIDNYLSIS